MSEFEEYPEEKGYFNAPGFVKGNPFNNESYLAKCKESLPEWADILQDAHDRIVAIDPDYNIVQIKSKFGGLRFYVHFSGNLTDEQRTEAYNIVSEAELAAGLLD